GGAPVGGALTEGGGRPPRLLACGAAPRASAPAGTLLEACYYHSIRFAVEHGFTRLSLGTCRPVLTDGVLRYKRKWGGTLGRPATWDAFLLHYRNTPAGRGLLTDAPHRPRPGRWRLPAPGARSGAPSC